MLYLIIFQFSLKISTTAAPLTYPQSKLTHVKEEKENENKVLLIRCQDAEKIKLVGKESPSKELIELQNNVEHLHSEVGRF